MSSNVRIVRLALHPGLLPLLKVWFRAEWPRYYGPSGPGDAQADLRAYANGHALPVGLVAFRDNEVCGVAALKAQSIASRSDLGPWAGAGLVPLKYRRQGTGTRLLHAVETVAKELGFPRANGWQLLERITNERELVAIYEKAL